MTKVYIVMGLSGEWSDAEYWEVSSYLDKGQADIHCSHCNKIVKEMSEGDRGTKRNPYDPDMRYARNISYAVTEVPLFDHFDQFQESVGL